MKITQSTLQACLHQNGKVISYFEHQQRQVKDLIKELFQVADERTDEGRIAFVELNLQRDLLRRLNKSIANLRIAQKVLKNQLRVLVEENKYPRI